MFKDSRGTVEDMIAKNGETLRVLDRRIALYKKWFSWLGALSLVGLLGGISVMVFPGLSSSTHNIAHLIAACSGMGLLGFCLYMFFSSRIEKMDEDIARHIDDTRAERFKELGSPDLAAAILARRKADPKQPT